MMLWLILESAARSFLLGAIVWFGLKALRVRSPQELTAWTIVLAAALAMPLLMQIAVVAVPTRLPIPAPVGEIMSPPLSLEASTLPALSPEPAAAPLPQAAASLAVDWRALATGFYLLVAGVLLLRLMIGVAMIWRLARAARPVGEGWVAGSDVRVSRQVGMPVAFGRVILLPADCAHWSAIKRQAVLSHERSHVARGDYTVLLLAALHRAIFWFNPLSWWLLSRLAALMEAASDDAAIADLRDRGSYAEILLDIAGSAGRAPAGVAMARPATVARRIERILRETKLPTTMRRGQRTLVAASLLPVALMAAGTIAQTPPIDRALAVDDLMVASAGKLARVSPTVLQISALNISDGQFDILLVPFRALAGFRAVSVLPIRDVPATILVDAQLSSAPSTDSASAADLSGTWQIRGGFADGAVALPLCVFQQDGDNLTGKCKALNRLGLNSIGTARGSIQGRQIEIRWQARSLLGIGGFGRVDFSGTLGPDGAITRTATDFRNSPGKFIAERSTSTEPLSFYRGQNGIPGKADPNNFGLPPMPSPPTNLQIPTK